MDYGYNSNLFSPRQSRLNWRLALQTERFSMELLLKTLSRLIFVFTLGRLRYSRPIEGNSLHMNWGEKFWYAYKFYGHPIYEPEHNKGIREHFEEHPIEGFNKTSLSDESLTIGLAGDLLPCPDFPATPSGHLADVVSFFTQADINCANLESPVARRQPKSILPKSIASPPGMNNSPEAVLYLLQGALRQQGTPSVTVFSTANNHSLDTGVEGVIETLDFLDETGARQVGMARNAAERDALLLLEVKGFKIAFLSWTFGLNNNTLPEGQEYLVNTLRLNLPNVDISPLASQVQEARQRGAEFVVLCLHWGLEYEGFPLVSQIETAHRLAECGVDVICGNHPHMLQPAERYVWGEQRECLIAYALGDLLSPYPSLHASAITAVMQVTLVRQSDGCVVIQQVTRDLLDGRR